MACGTPVVCSNASSLPEVAGDAALLVNPTDVEGLAEAMRRALSGERLRAEMVAKGAGQGPPVYLAADGPADTRGVPGGGVITA